MNRLLPLALLFALFAIPAIFAEETRMKKPAAKAAEGGSTETEIKSNGDANFDAEAHTATFVGGVTVTDARFSMHSEKLTVFLLKPAKDGATPTPAPAGAKSPGGSIERAVAEGGVTIDQSPKPGVATGDESQRVTGRAERAVFEPKTGSVTLTGSPVVRRGTNEHIATSAATVMVITREGGLKTTGPSRTIIRESGNSGDPFVPASTKKP